MSYSITSNRRLQAIAIAAFVCVVVATMGNVSSVQAEAISVDSLSSNSKPASVPDGYELTPAGWLNSSCVHAVEENEAVIKDNDKYLIVGMNVEQLSKVRETKDGKIQTSTASEAGALSDISSNQRSNAKVINPCSKPKFDSSGNVISENRISNKLASSVSAWKTNANARLGNMSYLHAQWNVPPAPASSAGQTIFLFPGFEDNPGTLILQPVLAWNPRSHWTLTNWNCGGDSCFHGESVPVTGSTVSGDVSGNGCNAATGVCSSWTITALDWGTQRSTTLSTNVGSKPLNWTFGGVLEAYNVTKCSHLPGGTVTFSNLYFEDVRDVRKYPNWQFDVNSNYPNCGYGASGNSSAVTLRY